MTIRRCFYSFLNKEKKKEKRLPAIAVSQQRNPRFHRHDRLIVITEIEIVATTTPLVPAASIDERDDTPPARGADAGREGAGNGAATRRS